MAQRVTDCIQQQPDFLGAPISNCTSGRNETLTRNSKRRRRWRRKSDFPPKIRGDLFSDSNSDDISLGNGGSSPENLNRANSNQDGEIGYKGLRKSKSLANPGIETELSVTTPNNRDIVAEISIDFIKCRRDAPRPIEAALSSPILTSDEEGEVGRRRLSSKKGVTHHRPSNSAIYGAIMHDGAQSNTPITISTVLPQPAQTVHNEADVDIVSLTQTGELNLRDTLLELQKSVLRIAGVIQSKKSSLPYGEALLRDIQDVSSRLGDLIIDFRMQSHLPSLSTKDAERKDTPIDSTLKKELDEIKAGIQEMSNAMRTTCSQQECPNCGANLSSVAPEKRQLSITETAKPIPQVESSHSEALIEDLRSVDQTTSGHTKSESLVAKGERVSISKSPLRQSQISSGRETASMRSASITRKLSRTKTSALPRAASAPPPLPIKAEIKPTTNTRDENLASSSPDDRASINQMVMGKLAELQQTIDTIGPTDQEELEAGEGRVQASSATMSTRNSKSLGDDREILTRLRERLATMETDDPEYFELVNSGVIGAMSKPSTKLSESQRTLIARILSSSCSLSLNEQVMGIVGQLQEIITPENWSHEDTTYNRIQGMLDNLKNIIADCATTPSSLEGNGAASLRRNTGSLNSISRPQGVGGEESGACVERVTPKYVSPSAVSSCCTVSQISICPVDTSNNRQRSICSDGMPLKSSSSGFGYAEEPRKFPGPTACPLRGNFLQTKTCSALQPATRCTPASEGNSCRRFRCSNGCIQPGGVKVSRSPSFPQPQVVCSNGHDSSSCPAYLSSVQPNNELMDSCNEDAGGKFMGYLAHIESTGIGPKSTKRFCAPDSGLEHLNALNKLSAGSGVKMADSTSSPRLSRLMAELRQTIQEVEPSNGSVLIAVGMPIESKILKLISHLQDNLSSLSAKGCLLAKSSMLAKVSQVLMDIENEIKSHGALNPQLSTTLTEIRKSIQKMTAPSLNEDLEKIKMAGAFESPLMRSESLVLANEIARRESDLVAVRVLDSIKNSVMLLDAKEPALPEVTSILSEIRNSIQMLEDGPSQLPAPSENSSLVQKDGHVHQQGMAHGSWSRSASELHHPRGSVVPEPAKSHPNNLISHLRDIVELVDADGTQFRDSTVQNLKNTFYDIETSLLQRQSRSSPEIPSVAGGFDRSVTPKSCGRFWGGRGSLNCNNICLDQNCSNSSRGTSPCLNELEKEILRMALQENCNAQKKEDAANSVMQEVGGIIDEAMNTGKPRSSATIKIIHLLQELQDSIDTSKNATNPSLRESTIVNVVNMLDKIKAKLHLTGEGISSRSESRLSEGTPETDPDVCGMIKQIQESICCLRASAGSPLSRSVNRLPSLKINSEDIPDDVGEQLPVQINGNRQSSTKSCDNPKQQRKPPPPDPCAPYQPPNTKNRRGSSEASKSLSKVAGKSSDLPLMPSRSAKKVPDDQCSSSLFEFDGQKKRNSKSSSRGRGSIKSSEGGASPSVAGTTSSGGAGGNKRESKPSCSGKGISIKTTDQEGPCCVPINVEISESSCPKRTYNIKHCGPGETVISVQTSATDSGCGKKLSKASAKPNDAKTPKLEPEPPIESAAPTQDLITPEPQSNACPKDPGEQRMLDSMRETLKNLGCKGLDDETAANLIETMKQQMGAESCMDPRQSQRRSMRLSDRFRQSLTSLGSRKKTTDQCVTSPAILSGAGPIEIAAGAMQSMNSMSEQNATDEVGAGSRGSRLSSRIRNSLRGLSPKKNSVKGRDVSQSPTVTEESCPANVLSLKETMKNASIGAVSACLPPDIAAKFAVMGQQGLELLKCADRRKQAECQEKIEQLKYSLEAAKQASKSTCLPPDLAVKFAEIGQQGMGLLRAAEDHIERKKQEQETEDMEIMLKQMRQNMAGCDPLAECSPEALTCRVAAMGSEMFGTTQSPDCAAFRSTCQSGRASSLGPDALEVLRASIMSVADPANQQLLDLMESVKSPTPPINCGSKPQNKNAKQFCAELASQRGNIDGGSQRSCDGTQSQREVMDQEILSVLKDVRASIRSVEAKQSQPNTEVLEMIRQSINSPKSEHSVMSCMENERPSNGMETCQCVEVEQGSIRRSLGGGSMNGEGYPLGESSQHTPRSSFGSGSMGRDVCKCVEVPRPSGRLGCGGGSGGCSGGGLPAVGCVGAPGFYQSATFNIPSRAMNQFCPDEAAPTAEREGENPEVLCAIEDIKKSIKEIENKTSKPTPEVLCMIQEVRDSISSLNTSQCTGKNAAMNPELCFAMEEIRRSIQGIEERNQQSQELANREVMSMLDEVRQSMRSIDVAKSQVQDITNQQMMNCLNDVRNSITALEARTSVQHEVTPNPELVGLLDEIRTSINSLEVNKAVRRDSVDPEMISMLSDIRQSINGLEGKKAANRPPSVNMLVLNGEKKEKRSSVNSNPEIMNSLTGIRRSIESATSLRSNTRRSRQDSLEMRSDREVMKQLNEIRQSVTSIQSIPYSQQADPQLNEVRNSIHDLQRDMQTLMERESINAMKLQTELGSQRANTLAQELADIRQGMKKIIDTIPSIVEAARSDLSERRSSSKSRACYDDEVVPDQDMVSPSCKKVMQMLEEMRHERDVIKATFCGSPVPQPSRPPSFNGGCGGGVSASVPPVALWKTEPCQPPLGAQAYPDPTVAQPVTTPGQLPSTFTLSFAGPPPQPLNNGQPMIINIGGRTFKCSKLQQ